ncbi:MAG: HPt (histidine-containing phosphotransfer) domain-containing protein [Oleispira sp.]
MLDKTAHFDIEALVMLEEIMGDDFPELIQVFIADSDPRVSAMQLALEEQNSSALRNIAHSFKGASSNLSALPLANLCFKVEEKAHDTNLEGIQLLITAIASEYQAVKSILLSLIK